MLHSIRRPAEKMTAAARPDALKALETAAGGAGANDSLGDAFLRDGYVIRPAEDRDALLRIQRYMADSAAESLGMALPADPTRFLDEIGKHVRPDGLNAFRLHVINRLNEADWARQAYFGLARRTIESIIGNELAMQRNFALSIQLPEDDSSLLPTHADVWSECSPFEMVLWTAFGSCFALLLGYSRIPFAAARDGNFFRVFARLHPTQNFPHVSLVVIGVLAVVCTFLPLMTV